MGLGVRAQWHKPRKFLAYLFCDITHKKLKSKTSQFFQSKLEDFASLLRVWTAF